MPSKCLLDLTQKSVAHKRRATVVSSVNHAPYVSIIIARLITHHHPFFPFNHFTLSMPAWMRIPNLPSST